MSGEGKKFVMLLEIKNSLVIYDFNEGVKVTAIISNNMVFKQILVVINVIIVC